MQPTIFDAGAHQMSFGGVPLGGGADGTFVKVEQREPTFSDKAGARGDVVRIRSRDRRGTITLTFLATDQANDILQAAHEIDRLTGLGVRPFFLKDMNGRTRVLAQNAWVTKPPEVEIGKEVGNREWVLACDEIQIFSGGGTVLP